MVPLPPGGPQHPNFTWIYNPKKQPQLSIYFRPFIEVITPWTTGRGPDCVFVLQLGHLNKITCFFINFVPES